MVFRKSEGSDLLRRRWARRMKNSGETGIVLNECCPLQRSQVCAGLAQREDESAMGLEIAA